MYYLGANVFGISNKKITNPSNFEILKLNKKIKSKNIDIRKRTIYW